MELRDYAIREKPQLVEDMQGGPDYIVLKSLDTDGIRLIGSVLGQSIALDYFVSQVDGLVEEFAGINRGMEKTGTFTMDKKKLLQLVGKANSNLADVILKVGLFERSEIAWRDAKYAQIYEYLREEYEVAQRFGNLDYKLKFVEHNIHFLQEVLQNRKSDFLEWCIIGLLTIENVISIYEILKDSNAVSQTISPICWTLGEKVITNCAFKLKPYLMQAVVSSGRTLDMYPQIVTSICQNQPESQEHIQSLVQAVENNLVVPKDAHEVTFRVEESEVGEINRSQVWKAARVNKSGVIDNENVQRVVDQCEKLTEALSEEERQDLGPTNILFEALNLPNYSGRVRTYGFGRI
ncbi:unnamed protein product [Vicia faba]|uniref:DUF155 domain-containing protein n=1 Tax=Vicia faba TaxID=3906 RepID=A0AAV1BD39_VICFA|nr:unnamed protein product [Vicia faba]